MSGHQSTSTPSTGPVKPEAYWADHEQMWSSFTHAALVGIICIVVLLIGMAIFLL